MRHEIKSRKLSLKEQEVLNHLTSLYNGESYNNDIEKMMYDKIEEKGSINSYNNFINKYSIENEITFKKQCLYMLSSSGRKIGEGTSCQWFNTTDTVMDRFIYNNITKDMSKYVEEYNKKLKEKRYA